MTPLLVEDMVEHFTMTPLLGKHDTPPPNKTNNIKVDSTDDHDICSRSAIQCVVLGLFSVHLRYTFTYVASLYIKKNSQVAYYVNKPGRGHHWGNLGSGEDQA